MGRTWDMSLGITSFQKFCDHNALSLRQREILLLLLGGLDPKTIATHLRLAPSTVRRHAIEMYRKCGVTSQREVLAMVARIGFAPELGQGTCTSHRFVPDESGPEPEAAADVWSRVSGAVPTASHE